MKIKFQTDDLDLAIIIRKELEEKFNFGKT